MKKYILIIPFLFFCFIFCSPASAATFIATSLSSCTNGTYLYPYFVFDDGSSTYRFRPTLCNPLNSAGIIEFNICDQPYYQGYPVFATSTYICGTSNNNGAWIGSTVNLGALRAVLSVPEAYPCEDCQSCIATSSQYDTNIGMITAEYSDGSRIYYSVPFFLFLTGIIVIFSIFCVFIIFWKYGSSRR
jgi:hypothetical protein